MQHSSECAGGDLFDLRLRKIVVQRVTVVKLEWTIEAAMVLAVLESRQGRIQRSSRIGEQQDLENDEI